MLLKENFTKEHIRELQETSHRDPVLLERAVYAFGLLEALVKVGLPFIFKGGTCLMLLMDHPRRLSTDIDIIVEPGTEVDVYLQKSFLLRLFKNKSVSERTILRKDISSLPMIHRLMTDCSIFFWMLFLKKIIIQK